MKLIVTQSGLKAITKEHGLTEYWSHRITYCCAPPELPKIFCWVYRHEGRKLKQELRCHAVLCVKESIARQIAIQLQARLTQALIEFKRDKLSRQNARLSLANSVYDNPSLPRRKILLSTGCHNYRPPLERSKSAPKLMAIEESLEEEDENLESKKFAKRIDSRSKFATYRNLSYSNRGNRLGGLNGLKTRSATIPRKSSPQREKENSSQFIEEENVRGSDVVEENPFGCDKKFDLLEELQKELALKKCTSDNGCNGDDDEKMNNNVIDVNENINDSKTAEKYFHRKSWLTSDGYSSCPSYADTISNSLNELPKYNELLSCVDDSISKYDSLVRSRRKLFENAARLNTKIVCAEDGDESPCKNFVKNRKKLFDNLEKAENACTGDTDSALHFDISEENRDSWVGSVDDESTPSLQSISSGSDTSSPRDIKNEFTKNCDLHSLSEEDSDESGFAEPVEAIGQDSNDDKNLDLPLPQLMKNCILSSKSRCVEV